MTRAVAIDCAPYGIRVNSLAPGPIDTQMMKDWRSQSEDLNSDEKENASVILKRLGTAEEIARVALFLISDDSSFMTGSLVVADGGVTAW